jgi:hypothetical protein
MSMSFSRLPSCLVIPFLTMAVTAVTGSAAADQDMMIGISLDRLVFTERDMADTYGKIAVPSVIAAADIADRARFVMTAGYGFTRGNPFRGHVGFEGDDEAELKAILLRFGVQGDLSRHPRLHVFWGLSAGLARFHERLPARASPPDHDDFDGWGTGLQLTFGPEWNTADAARAVGLMMGWGVIGGDALHEGLRHEVNMTGIALQCYYMWRM